MGALRLAGRPHPGDPKTNSNRAEDADQEYSVQSHTRNRPSRSQGVLSTSRPARFQTLRTDRHRTHCDLDAAALQLREACADGMVRATGFAQTLQYLSRRQASLRDPGLCCATPSAWERPVTGWFQGPVWRAARGCPGRHLRRIGVVMSEECPSHAARSTVHLLASDDPVQQRGWLAELRTMESRHAGPVGCNGWFGRCPCRYGRSPP